MIALEKAWILIREHLLETWTEMLSLPDAPGRILAEDLRADRDMPPFDKASMDGFACRKEDLPGPFRILEELPAGKLPGRTVGPGTCSRIMTGGQVPEGADCVLMQEYVERRPDGRYFFHGAYSEAYICKKGEDMRRGDLLLQRGSFLDPQHLGMMAAAGIGEVKVRRKIRAGILATGNELIDYRDRPHGAEIRNSNSLQLAAQVQRSGHSAEPLGIVRDVKEELAERISAALGSFDLLLLTGGASVGEYDLVPAVLRDLGFTLEFEQVAMQPGKPLTFAHREGKRCFGLSGNPVSSFVQFELLVRPFLRWSSGGELQPRRVRCRVKGNYERTRTDRLFFLPVRFNAAGECQALNYHGSAHLHALNNADGWAEMPAGKKSLKEGEEVYVRLI